MLSVSKSIRFMTLSQTKRQYRISTSTTETLLFLVPIQVKRMYWMLPSSREPIQQPLLQSAVYSPMNVKHYTQQNNVFQLAAIFFEKIAKNHPFPNRNKEIAVFAADMFLRINGFQLLKTPMSKDGISQALADAHVAVVANRVSAEELGAYYESIATPALDESELTVAFRNEAIEY